MDDATEIIKLRREKMKKDRIEVYVRGKELMRQQNGSNIDLPVGRCPAYGHINI